MSTNKSISYLLCNNGIIVNLYKLHFLSSHFSFQPNKRVFHPPTFSSLQPNTYEGKLNIFHPPIIFHPPTFSLLQPNRHLVFNKISIFPKKKKKKDVASHLRVRLDRTYFAKTEN